MNTKHFLNEISKTYFQGMSWLSLDSDLLLVIRFQTLILGLVVLI